MSRAVRRRSIPCPLRNVSSSVLVVSPLRQERKRLIRPMLVLGRGSKCLVGVESLIFGAKEGDAHVVRVVVCECDNGICCPPDSGQERGARLSGLPHQICPPGVQRACSELACGWTLHARTNRMCTLSEMRMEDCISGDVFGPPGPVQVE